jgi:hypothetical protein
MCRPQTSLTARCSATATSLRCAHFDTARQQHPTPEARISPFIRVLYWIIPVDCLIAMLLLIDPRALQIQGRALQNIEMNQTVGKTTQFGSSVCQHKCSLASLYANSTLTFSKDYSTPPIRLGHRTYPSVIPVSIGTDDVRQKKPASHTDLAGIWALADHHGTRPPI